MNHMKKVKTHFENEAKEFDELILKLIPFYHEMLQALVLSIPFVGEEAIRVIDLGCGTGTIAKKIKEKFLNSKITCLDLAENMIKMAKTKLQDYQDVSFCIGDFYDYQFAGKYDVVISSLALHHLESEEDKKKFYLKIYEALTEKGVFYNADVVLASSDFIQEAYLEKWKSFMRKNVSKEEVENIWIPKYREEDRPVQLIKQLSWLEEIGFREVDVIWKYYNFAVYGGRKRGELNCLNVNLVT